MHTRVPSLPWNLSHRLYTVTVATAAALLVAAFVWFPAIPDDARHDVYLEEHLFTPMNKKGVQFSKLQKYAKVTALSAAIGHAVKLALLSNLSPPTARSKGIKVPQRVWRRQVVVSMYGLATLTVLIASYVTVMVGLQMQLSSVVRSAATLAPNWWVCPVGLLHEA